MSWRLLLAFAAGVVLATLVPGLPPLSLTATAMLVGVGLTYWSRTRLPAALLLGAGWFLLQAGWLVERQWPDELAGDEMEIVGTIVDLPQAYGQNVRFLLRPDPVGNQKLPARIQVSWYRPLEYLQPGQRWRMTLRLNPPHGRLNPASFDFHRHLLSNRIGALATVVDRPEKLDSSRTRGWIDRQRQFLAEVLQAETANPDAGALKRALSIADRGGMPPELAETLRQTGTAHLLAISGLHVGMVAGIAGLISGWLLAPLVLLSSRLDRRRLAIAGALAAALAYALLAGLTLPTQRALVMLAVGAGAFVLRRGIQPAHALLLALVAVLLLDPLAPLATGFWLSFAAVAILIWAFAWRPGMADGGRGWLTGLVRAQLIIAVGMLPLNVGIFHQLVPIALLANLVAIPMVAFWILPGLLASVALILLGLPADWPMALTDAGLDMLVRILGILHGFEFGHGVVVGGGLAAIVLAMAGALWLLAPPGWPARWLGAFALLPLLFPKVELPGEGELQLQMLDAGNGLAVILRTSEEVVLYDTGPGDGEGGDLLGRTLPGLLAGMGVSGVDRVVVSHRHRGHAGGLGSVVELFPNALIHSSFDVPGKACETGAGWSSGGHEFRFLHPAPGLPDLEANSSCVLHVAGPGGSVLLTGGIDQAVEDRLLLENPDLVADVLVLSAGGHRRASNPVFLQQLRPDFALASVAAFDRFERPHPEVLANIADAGIELVSTGRCGAIRVKLKPDSPTEIRTMVGQFTRFWHPWRACP